MHNNGCIQIKDMLRQKITLNLSTTVAYRQNFEKEQLSRLLYKPTWKRPSRWSGVVMPLVCPGMGGSGLWNKRWHSHYHMVLRKTWKLGINYQQLPLHCGTVLMYKHDIRYRARRQIETGVELWNSHNRLCMKLAQKMTHKRLSDNMSKLFPE